MWLKVNVFLLICLDDLSIDRSGVLNSPTTIVLLSVFTFMSVNICLCIDAPVLSAYVFTIIISSSWPFFFSP